MAATFSHHSLSFAPPSLPFRTVARTPSRTLSVDSLRVVKFSLSLTKSISRLQTTLPIGKGSFSPRVKITESDSSTIDGEENSKPKRTQVPLQTIIPVYKEAILEGDEKTVSELEVAICAIEAEKNELLKKVTSLPADISSEKNNYLRLQADLDNFRKRSESAKLTLTSDVRGEVVESLLPVIDNFERAKLYIKPETEKETKITTSYQGIYKQLVEILRSLQVAVVETVGKPFDPSFHEAIAREECSMFKEGIVVEEVRRGFVLGGRLLRPAKVKVSSGPRRQKAQSPVEKTAEQTKN